jgi:hypothetical protein
LTVAGAVEVTAGTAMNFLMDDADVFVLVVRARQQRMGRIGSHI